MVSKYIKETYIPSIERMENGQRYQEENQIFKQVRVYSYYALPLQ